MTRTKGYYIHIKIGDNDICSQLFRTPSKAIKWLGDIRFDNLNNYKISIRYVNTKTQESYVLGVVNND